MRTGGGQEPRQEGAWESVTEVTPAWSSGRAPPRSSARCLPHGGQEQSRYRDAKCPKGMSKWGPGTWPGRGREPAGFWLERSSEQSPLLSTRCAQCQPRRHCLACKMHFISLGACSALISTLTVLPEKEKRLGGERVRAGRWGWQG